jgi:hypothetical protein
MVSPCNDILFRHEIFCKRVATAFGPDDRGVGVRVRYGEEISLFGREYKTGRKDVKHCRATGDHLELDSLVTALMKPKRAGGLAN